MKLEDCTVGVAMTGSFCTYKKMIEQIELLVAHNINVIPIFSDSAQTLDSRFGHPKDLWIHLRKSHRINLY